MNTVNLLMVLELMSGSRVEKRLKKIDVGHPWMRLNYKDIVEYKCGLYEGEARIQEFPYRSELRMDDEEWYVLSLKAISSES